MDNIFNWNKKWVSLHFEAFLHYKENKDQVKNITSFQSPKAVNQRGHRTRKNTIDHTRDVIVKPTNQKKHFTMADYWGIFVKIYGSSIF